MNEQQRFRSSAAGGIAVACLVLGAPFAVVRILNGDLLTGLGGIASTVLLILHTLLLRRNHPASRVTLAAMTAVALWYLVFLLRSYSFTGLLWCFPGILALYCLLPERLAWLANLTLYGLVLFYGQQVLHPDVLVRAAVTLLAVNLFAALLLRAVTAQFHSLQRQIATDPLTGLLNRHELEHALETRLSSRRRADASSALLALDLDHFKRVNDDFGHAVGDELLCDLGRCLNASIRTGDDAFRIGGEEFLVVLGNLEERDAVERAEAIRAAVAADLSRSGCRVTVSIGVASALPEDTWSQWMSRADAALYRAKAEGRNRVCVGVAADDRGSEETSAATRPTTLARVRAGANA